MGLQDRTFSFARHGEAQHNKLIRDGRDREGRALLDPALTEAGEAQACQLAEALRPPERQFDIIVTSPLCRALQTASKIAETQDDVEIIVTSLHTETAMPPADPCQRGSRDAQAISEKYPRFDVARIRTPRDWLCADGGWFAPRPAEARLAEFREFLNALPPHKDVLVVGHAGFFKRLFGEDQKMGNCEVVTRALDGGAVAAGEWFCCGSAFGLPARRRRARRVRDPRC